MYAYFRHKTENTRINATVTYKSIVYASAPSLRSRQRRVGWKSSGRKADSLVPCDSFCSFALREDSSVVTFLLRKSELSWTFPFHVSCWCELSTLQTQTLRACFEWKQGEWNGWKQENCSPSNSFHSPSSKQGCNFVKSTKLSTNAR